MLNWLAVAHAMSFVAIRRRVVFGIAHDLFLPLPLDKDVDVAVPSRVAATLELTLPAELLEERNRGHVVVVVGVQGVVPRDRDRARLRARLDAPAAVVGWAEILRFDGLPVSHKEVLS